MSILRDPDTMRAFCSHFLSPTQPFCFTPQVDGTLLVEGVSVPCVVDVSQGACDLALKFAPNDPDIGVKMLVIERPGVQRLLVLGNDTFHYDPAPAGASNVDLSPVINQPGGILRQPVATPPQSSPVATPIGPKTLITISSSLLGQKVPA